MTAAGELEDEPGGLVAEHAVGALPDAPRFSIGIERERVVLTLARPLVVEGIEVRALELELDARDRALRAADGWWSFRHRASRVRRGSVRVAWPLASLDEGAPIVVSSLLHTSKTRATLVLRADLATPTRSVAADVTFCWEGPDLLLVPQRIRGGASTSETPHATLARLLSSTGWSLRPERGVFLRRDPAWEALATALLPFGVRVPDLRMVARDPVAIDGATLAIELGERRDAQDDELARAAVADALALAPMRSALFANDAARARTELERLRPVIGDARTRVAMAELAGAGEPTSASTSGDELLDAHATMVRAMTAGDVRSASRALETLRRLEPATALVGDAALDAAELAGRLHHDARPALAALAVESFTARDPGWLRALALGATAAPRDVLARLAPELESVHRAQPTDVTTLIALTEVAASLDDRATLERTTALLDRLGSQDLDALEALARHHPVALGRTTSWDRAAALAIDRRERERAALAWLAGARSEHGAGRIDDARVRLSRALALEITDVRVLVALAREAARLGADTEAVVVARALVRAASFFTDATAPSELVAALEESIPAVARDGRRERVVDVVDALVRLRPDRREELLGLVPIDDPFATLAALPAAERGAAARRFSEARLAEGSLGDAARALSIAGLAEDDAATLRAALDLAERGGARAIARAIVDALLPMVGAGIARDALERRRARLAD